jgi:oxygen-independent coproporphyrinogen-3 oxidase
MIYIDIENLTYYDDANVLVKSFYPRTDVLQLKSGVAPDAEDMVIKVPHIEDASLTKSDAHNEFKRKLYEQLSTETGKKLPWGFMTGVRPSKMAYVMMEEGWSDTEILDEFTEKHYASAEKANLALNVAKTEKKILDRLDYRNGYSLYIGIPFCPTTCLYCSFTSYSVASYRDKVDAYLDALIEEMGRVSEMFSGRRLDTVYFGGGTPTTLEPEQLDRLLCALEQYFDMSTVSELTVEAGRPDSITAEKLETLKAHGVQRISINPQTMNDETLKIIGRRHTVSQVEQAFETARNVGFNNINMDIIMGLPGEDVPEIKNTLEKIKKLSPESLTVHSLAIKRAAALNIWRDKYRDLSLLNSDEIMAMTEHCSEELGMKPYYMYRQKNMAGNFENVGYSQAGKECIYNILIMEEKQTIVALGAGATTKRVYPDGRIERCENVKDVASYIDRVDEMVERKRELMSD